MHKQPLEYSDGKTSLEGYITWSKDHKGSRPAILIAHDWSGCGPFVQKKAEYFAKKGYVGFAVDVYGKGKRGSSSDTSKNLALMTPLMENRSLIPTRLKAALQTIREFDIVDSEQIAIIGFCFGGLCALDFARSKADIKGAISVHGLLSPPDNAPIETISSKILVLHGYEDKLAPPEQVQAFQEEMTARKADWQVHMYSNTLHAFTNPEANSPKFDPEGNPPSFGVQFNAQANDRTWQAIDNFLKEIFY